MKGLLHTETLLRAVLNKEWGITAERPGARRTLPWHKFRLTINCSSLPTQP